MRLLAAKPLAFDPGTAWNYSMSTDVCGRLVEVQMGLDEYFAEHITGPLGMADTAFHVPADKVHRFTSNYQLTPEDPLATFDAFDASPYLSPPVFLSAAVAWSVPSTITSASSTCCSTAANSTA